MARLKKPVEPFVGTIGGRPYSGRRTEPDMQADLRSCHLLSRMLLSLGDRHYQKACITWLKALVLLSKPQMIRPAPGSFPRMPLAQNSARGSATNVNPVAPLSEPKIGGTLPQVSPGLPPHSLLTLIAPAVTSAKYGCPQPAERATNGSPIGMFPSHRCTLGSLSRIPTGKSGWQNWMDPGIKRHMHDVGNEFIHIPKSSKLY